MTHQLEPLLSIQSSPESESLDEGDLGLLAGGSITQGYYDQMADSLIEAKVQSDGTINNEELHKAITILKSENKAEHKRNILNTTELFQDRKSVVCLRDG